MDRCSVPPALDCSQGGRDVHRGQAAGYGSGEGPSSGTAAVHTVKILNRAAGQEMEVEVPEDRCAPPPSAPSRHPTAPSHHPTAHLLAGPAHGRQHKGRPALASPTSTWTPLLKLRQLH